MDGVKYLDGFLQALVVTDEFTGRKTIDGWNL